MGSPRLRRLGFHPHRRSVRPSRVAPNPSRAAGIPPPARPSRRRPSPERTNHHSTLAPPPRHAARARQASIPSTPLPRPPDGRDQHVSANASERPAKFRTRIRSDEFFQGIGNGGTIEGFTGSCGLGTGSNRDISATPLRELRWCPACEQLSLCVVRPEYSTEENRTRAGELSGRPGTGVTPSAGIRSQVHK